LLRRPLSEITTGDLERWRARRELLGRSPRKEAKAPSAATINRDLAALRSAFERAIEWRHITTNPLARYKHGKEDTRAIVRFLSTVEEQRLRIALANRDNVRREARVKANLWRRERGYKEWTAYGLYTDHLAPLVLLALNTGLRRGELLRLRWAHVNLTRAFLTVEGADAKSGQTRHVPLNSEVLKVLRVWSPDVAAAGAFVFPGADSETPMQEVKRGWRSLLRKARIEEFRFHDLRHTFASKLVMAGVDLNTVRELLGHSTIGMTLRYAHLGPEHKALAVERLIDTTG
jgi:integrase